MGVNIKINIQSKYLIIIALIAMCGMILYSPWSPLASGDITTITLIPDGVGSNTECTPMPSPGDNWLWASEENDGRKVTGLATMDTYSIENIEGRGDISLVKQNLIFSVPFGIEIYPHDLKYVLLIDGTPYFSNLPVTFPLNEGSYSFTVTWEVNPATEEAWTVEDINDLEAGFKLPSQVFTLMTSVDIVSLDVIFDDYTEPFDVTCYTCDGDKLLSEDYPWECPDGWYLEEDIPDVYCGNPPEQQDAPGFELVVFLVSLILVVMLLKRRKHV